MKNILLAKHNQFPFKYTTLYWYHDFLPQGGHFAAASQSHSTKSGIDL